MKIGDGVEWAIHCCTVLATLPDGTSLPAARLAELHGVPAAYLAKHLQALAAAGIVAALPGRRGGYRLARPAEELTLLEVVTAVEGGDPAFRCTEIRRRGPCTGLPAALFAAPCAVASAMARAEAAWRKELQATTVADLARHVERHVDPRILRRVGDWLDSVL
ncbi:MAG: RrF2 family transcriptional regulator [Acidobacteriota bacterium]